MSIDAMGQSSQGKKGPTQGMVIDAAGTLTLEPGLYELTLKAAGQVRGTTESRDLLNPRAVFLLPVPTSGTSMDAPDPAVKRPNQ